MRDGADSTKLAIISSFFSAELSKGKAQANDAVGIVFRQMS